MRAACLRAGQLQQAEQEAGRWRIAASQAQAAAAKLEADMEGLGNAYNMLETHSHDLEARLQELESRGRCPAIAHPFLACVSYPACCAFHHVHMPLPMHSAPLER